MAAGRPCLVIDSETGHHRHAYSQVVLTICLRQSYSA